MGTNKTSWYGSMPADPAVIERALAILDQKEPRDKIRNDVLFVMVVVALLFGCLIGFLVALMVM